MGDMRTSMFQTHVPGQSSGQRQSQLMLLAHERLDERDNWTAVLGMAVQKTEIWPVSQMPVTAADERFPASASCRRAMSS